ncbi:hypothetical protein KC640_01330 [Candidatus Dojkabacteria bacterium]|uniref:Uncharacterized protein n=1 Tax=Candidatus Dojkabacteria bacterium TaxID=2099670 RepID=A0A955I700_9BACT|nr:hypothetical protein [Candidatus Dojkabacteria bacterium]
MAKHRAHRPKKNAGGELIFVYNVDTGVINDLRSTLKRYTDPENHDCQLIMLSWGLFGIKTEWERFLGRLPYSTFFIHRDVFIAQYPHRKFHPLPAIFVKKEGSLYQIFDRSELLEIKDLSTLEKKLQQKLKQF